MRHPTQSKPIRQLKAKAAEIQRQLSASRKPRIITDDGEARAVPVDGVRCEESPETLALLELLVLGHRDVEAGRTSSLVEVGKRLRGRVPD